MGPIDQLASHMWDWIARLLEFGALAGCVYLLYTALLVGRSFRLAPVPSGPRPPVTILKPLHGDEPLLFDNLEGLTRQDYRGPVQIVLGVDSPSDIALEPARRLAAAPGPASVDLVVRPRGPARNPKIANLINMMPAAGNDIIVLADSDIRVRPDYLSRLVAQLQEPGTGAVTCLYDGVAGAGFWSRMAAAAIDMHFLPSVVFGLAINFAQPCFGSTIAMRRQTLEEIGGFAAFADCLADDYAIGAAVRGTGRRVVVSPMTVTHVCGEATLRAMLRHELRWARTIRSIDPRGFAGSVLTHPFPLSLLALGSGGGGSAAALAVLALACRLVLWVRVDAVLGRKPSPYWLIPFRSVLSFGVFVVAFWGRQVDWQGRRYDVDPDGTLFPVGRGAP